MFTLTKNAINNVTMKWYINNLKEKIIMSEKEVQNLLKYKDEDLEKVISDIIRNIGIGNIVITEKNELIEGYKRLFAINEFIDNKIKYNGKYYSELSNEDKDIFDNYSFGIYIG